MNFAESTTRLQRFLHMGRTFIKQKLVNFIENICTICIQIAADHLLIFRRQYHNFSELLIIMQVNW